jgi:hypothetical protein
VVSQKPVPLSKLSEFFPEGERWAERWEGESEGNFKERQAKSRAEWISRYAKTMRVGTAKQKKSLQFYQEQVKQGRIPQPYHKPNPEGVQRILDVSTLLHCQGDEHWEWRWEGEGEDQWHERVRMGRAVWFTHIEGVKNSKRPLTKERVRFYVEMTRERRAPVPVLDLSIGHELKDEDEDEDPRSDHSLGRWSRLALRVLIQKAREEKLWRDQVRKDMPRIVQEARNESFGGMDRARKSFPEGLSEKQRIWWGICLDQVYRPFEAEDRQERENIRYRQW